MPGDLRIGRPVVGDGGRHHLRLAQLIHLHHPRGDRAARGLPDEATGKAEAEHEHAEEGEPPVLRLDAGRADALVPDLAGALIGRLGFGRLAVADHRPSKHGLFSLPEIDRGPAHGAIAGPHRVVGGGGATADGLIALHLPRPGRRPGCLRRTGRAGAC